MLYHDLALALGGMTVDELKQRMSAEEFSRWLEYVAVNGPLHSTIRLEQAIAGAASPFIKGGGKHLTPWPKKPEREASIDDFMNILRSAKKATATTH